MRWRSGGGRRMGRRREGGAGGGDRRRRGARKAPDGDGRGGRVRGGTKPREAKQAWSGARDARATAGSESASIEAPKTPTLKRIASKEDFRREHAIEIRNACERTRDLEPFTTFDEAAFPKPLRAALKAQGYDAPTPIQAEAWPILLKGKDVVAIAKTGSGKTCGFLLPALASIVARGSQKAREVQVVE